MSDFDHQFIAQSPGSRVCVCGALRNSAHGDHDHPADDYEYDVSGPRDGSARGLRR